MPYLVLTGLVAIVLWSLVSQRFQHWGVAGPAVLVALGAVAVVGDVEAFGLALDSPLSEKIVEVILAILLFIDATEVRNGLFGGQARVVARLVFLALPLSIIAAVAAGTVLLPGAGALVLIVVACVVLPTDFAPAVGLLRTPHLPARVRQIAAVESGYNDGMISPLFGMSLAGAVVWTTIENTPASALSERDLEQPLTEFLESFVNAVPATLVAIGIGLALGATIGRLVRAARERELADAAGARYVMLLLPLVAYGVASIPVLGANGFVAAFVAGIAYRLTRVRRGQPAGIDRDELLLVEEVGQVTSNFVWFVLGGATLLVAVSGVDWRMPVFALLALTILRIGPVYLALAGSALPPRERLLLGAIGPRGTASIVFGLLAFNALPDDEGVLVLTVMVTTVVGSIVLHGVAAPLLLRAAAGKDRVR